jgi:hypothetical protein
MISLNPMVARIIPKCVSMIIITIEEFYIKNFNPLVFDHWTDYRYDLNELLFYFNEVKEGEIKEFDLIFNFSDGTFYIVGKYDGYERYSVEEYIKRFLYSVYRYKHA